MRTSDMYRKQEEVIKYTVSPLSKEDFLRAFERLGLKKDMCVEVHTSLSAFGYIINKSYDVLDALVETITDGVIIIPAHTSEQGNPEYWVNPPVPKEWVPIINEKRKPFDRQIIVPERVGWTPIAFMNYPGVERTNHPIVSLSVLNNTNDASWLDHSLNDEEFINPLFKLTKSEGKILFLGTDFTTCTSIHLSEQFSPYSKRVTNTYRRVNDQGKVESAEEVTYEFDDDVVDNFQEISKLYIDKYEGTEHYKQVRLGNGIITLIDALRLYEIAEHFHKTFRKDQ